MFLPEVKCVKWILVIPILFVLSLPQTILPQSNDDCLMCHSDDGMTMEKKGKEVSLYVNDKILLSSSHSKLNCVSCHTGFDAEEIPHKENITAVNCLTCHKDSKTKHLFHPQILKSSGSNGTKDVSCKGCHGTHEVLPTSSPKSKWNKANLETSCGTCHNNVTDVYVHSEHAIAYKNGVQGAPSCITCHRQPIAKVNGEKDTLKVKLAQEKLCLSCHLDDPEIRKRTTPSAGFIQMYEKSVHGTELLKGNHKAAACVDCHTSHDVKDKNDLSSKVNRFNISATCGSCHTDIAKEYNESIHGISLAKGNKESPTCTDCHGEHNILRHDDPQSPVSFQRVSAEICTPCHSSLKLSEKYGIKTDRYKSFADSYHGLAIRGGSVEVANCASCHGVHNIKPSTDPTSTIHKDQLVETCGSCHPGANERFTIGRVHVTMDKEEEPILYWVATIYIILIITIVGGMVLHNFVDFYRKAKIKKMKQRGLIKEEHHGHALYLRMSLNERIQHATMALSFIILVITGFMLRYPESWWVTHIRDLSEDAFIYRSLLHRIAAVVMVAVSLYHIYYILFVPRGKQLVRDLWPRLQDMKDAIGVAKFNLGMSNEKPLLDRFSYIEKAEYWALVWGTIVMTVTGFILWFDNTFMGLLTKLGWDVARTIHYYEAWLAFLAIVVWHFYFVIFNPDVYPMNLAWLKGTLTEEEMAHEHPKELQKLKASETSDEVKKDEGDGNDNKKNS